MYQHFRPNSSTNCIDCRKNQCINRNHKNNRKKENCVENNKTQPLHLPYIMAAPGSQGLKGEKGEYSLGTNGYDGDKGDKGNTGYSGATVVAAAPLLLGFGSSIVQIIDLDGESISPSETGGFSFPIPFNGIIQNLQVSADIFVATTTSINDIPIRYVYTVFRAPSVPNNGLSHVSASYVTTALASTLTFDGPTNPVVADTFYTASNISLGTLPVSVGDRVGVRIRATPGSDPSTADITQSSFNASLSYVLV
ncbi:hypothetical protein [Powai lake megavirus]|uniref:Uncharacterized protein n=1 Tax=Powai lake megavirus TaxID=1842663 RepID=A0A161HRE5_9VIRU|nr:hypothetical protein QJ849_gp819 [Powai lake megavirus]ANB50981.1 hypothetical protein [Powai lake megavirus]